MTQPLLALSEFEHLITLAVAVSRPAGDLRVSVGALGRVLAQVDAVLDDPPDPSLAHRRIAVLVEAIGTELPMTELNDVLAVLASRFVAVRMGYRFDVGIGDITFRKFFAAASTHELNRAAFSAWLEQVISSERDAAEELQLVFPDLVVDPSVMDVLLGDPQFVTSLETSDDPPRAYLATPLTGVAGLLLDELEATCDAVAEALSECGIAAHQPIQHTHPTRHPNYTPRQIHEIDARQTMNADLMVAICPLPSTGTGKELAYGERYRVVELILAPRDVRISRLIEGATTGPEVRQYDSPGHAASIVRDFVDRRRRDIERHHQERLERKRVWARLFHSLRVAAAECGILSGEISLPLAISVARLKEILSSPEHMAGASLDEIAAIASALNVDLQEPEFLNSAAHPPALGQRELVALQDAAEIEGWDAPRALALARSASRLLAAGGQRRVRFLSVEDWVQFDGDINGG